MKKDLPHIFRILFVMLPVFIATGAMAQQRKVLVFSKTAGYRHEVAIAEGTSSIQSFGYENNFAVDVTEDAGMFTTDNLKQYAAVIFLCTTGDVLNDEQQWAFEQFIRSGRGFVGLHSAADTEYDWGWYGGLNGAYFKNHPQQQEAVFNIVDPDNIATRHLPAVWTRFDELYNFKWIANDLHVLITIDENSYSGGENGEYHPMSWYHEYDGGRAFYTALGHDNRSYDDPMFLKHILGGIKYAIGTKIDALPDVAGECSVTVTAPATIDNYGSTITATTSDPVTYNTQGAYVINWTFNYGNDNVSTTTQNVIIKDVTAPVVKTKDITVRLDENGAVTISPEWIDNGSTDNCGIAGYTLDKTNFTSADIGTNTVTLTVTDVNGNSASGTATVTVADNSEPPVTRNFSLYPERQAKPLVRLVKH